MLKFQTLWREILVYAILLVASYLPIVILFLLLFALSFLSSSTDLIPFLRYATNSFALSGMVPIGFLALATRRSKLFGIVTAVILTGQALIAALPNIPVYLQLSLMGYLDIAFSVFSGLLQVLLCLGTALLCRLVKNNWTAFLISAAVPALFISWRQFPKVPENNAAIFLLFLYGFGCILLLYPLSVWLKKLLLKKPASEQPLQVYPLQTD